MLATTTDVAKNSFVKEFVVNDMLYTDVLSIRKYAHTYTNVDSHMVIKGSYC